MPHLIGVPELAVTTTVPKRGARERGASRKQICQIEFSSTKSPPSAPHAEPPSPRLAHPRTTTVGLRGRELGRDGGSVVGVHVCGLGRVLRWRQWS